MVGEIERGEYMEKNLDPNYLAFVATQAVLEAGFALKQGFGTEFEISAKPGRQNIVTQYDHLSEKIILDKIKENFPSHTILAEEGGLSQKIDSETPLWIVDPLDGTSNFAHQIPLFSISVAVHYQGKGVFGIIYQPLTNELFIAVKDQGAFLNGKKMSVSQSKVLDDSLIQVGLPSHSTNQPTISIENLSKLNRTNVTTRNIGSAALALAYVAGGNLDALWMNNLYAWDWAAGKILIEEAGGQVTYFAKEEELYTHTSNILATNKILNDSLKSFVE